MKGKFILSSAFSKGNVNNFKKYQTAKKKNKIRDLQRVKNILKCHHSALEGGVAHTTSLLSVTQALSMQADTWPVCYITVRHRLTQKAQRSIVQLCSPLLVMPWSIS